MSAPVEVYPCTVSKTIEGVRMKLLTFKTYYWLYLAGTILPIILDKLIQIESGKLVIDSVISWVIIILTIIIPGIAATLAYHDKNKNETKA